MQRYCLKPMVLARLFAESTVLIAFISAPIVLLATGKMHSLGLPVQVLFYCLAGVGLAILPWFGFLTWQVRVDEQGLIADALFKHQFCAWESMKKITRRANFNWQRYVIEFEDGSLHFPVLLVKSDELVRLIRARLPKESSGEVGLSEENPRRVFRYDPVAMFLQIVQSVVACIFVLLFWMFFAFNMHKHFQNQQDAAMILIFCLAFSVIFVWRLIVVLMMPNRVELTQERLVLDNVFSSKGLSWLEILGLANPLPLLPEGFMIKTKRGNFLIGTGMDAADELQEIMLQELETVKHDLAFIAAAKQRVKSGGRLIELGQADQDQADVEVKTEADTNDAHADKANADDADADEANANEAGAREANAPEANANSSAAGTEPSERSNEPESTA